MWSAKKESNFKVKVSLTNPNSIKKKSINKGAKNAFMLMTLQEKSEKLHSLYSGWAANLRSKVKKKYDQLYPSELERGKGQLSRLIVFLCFSKMEMIQPYYHGISSWTEKKWESRLMKNVGIIHNNRETKIRLCLFESNVKGVTIEERSLYFTMIVLEVKRV